ncbi:hypothetical protein DL93DRAFT_2160589 [Clavulina sp. PMI_390]|nr:hypothetical protein DL93DRAFT_2160589 [Clavulina sp. PMI_390]
MDYLPFEILAKIMLTGAFSFDDHEYKKLIKYRIILSSVSARWRQIAVSTGSLWSIITVDIENKTVDGNAPLQGVLSILQLHLLRSGNTQLDFALLIGAEPSADSALGEEAVWKLVKPEMYRVRTFEIYGFAMADCILPLDDQYPSLRTFSLNPPIWCFLEDESTIFTTTATAPNPTSLQLTAMSFSVLQNIPQTNLTSLIMLYWDLSWSIVQNFLLECSKLEKCTLRGRIVESDTTYFPVLLPRVAFLDVEDPLLFDWISAPSLEWLVCYHHASNLADTHTRHNEPMNSESVAQFKLRSLELNIGLPRGFEFAQLLTRAALPFWETAFENVTTLVVRNSDNIIPLIIYLADLIHTYPDTEGPSITESQDFGRPRLLPSLQSLEIDNCNEMDTEDPTYNPIAGHLVYLLNVRPSLILTCDPGLLPDMEDMAPASKARIFLKESWNR